MDHRRLNWLLSAIAALAAILCPRSTMAERTNRLETRPCGPTKGSSDVDILVELPAVPSDARVRFSVDRSNSSSAFDPKEGPAKLCLRNTVGSQHRLRAELLAQGGLALYWAGTFDSGAHAGDDYTISYSVPFAASSNGVAVSIDSGIRPAREVLSPRNAEEARAACPSAQTQTEETIVEEMPAAEPTTARQLNEPAVEDGPSRFAAPGPCEEADGTSFSYSFGPLTLEIGANGRVQARLPNASISTPIGTFGIGFGSSLYHDGASCTLIVRWGQTEQIYKFDHPIDVVLAGVGQGMPEGATLRITKNERTGDSILLQISGSPGDAYYRRLLSEQVWFVHQVDFDRPGWLGARVRGHSIFSIEMLVEKVSADNASALCRVVQIRRYWEGNWGTTGIRENDILSLPYPDDRDSQFEWEAPTEFGGTVRKGASYWIPTDKLQSTSPF